MSDSLTVNRRFTVFVLAGIVLLAGATLAKRAYGHLTGEAFSLQFSTAVTRGNPNLLNGAVVTGDISVFTDPLFPLSDVKHVDFFINQGDNPAGSTKEIRERVAPYDLEGTAGNGNAVFFDTTTLTDGLNRISARVRFLDGHKTLLHADFTVNNGGGAPTGDYELGVAEVSDRTGGIAELIPPPPGFPLEALHGVLFIYLGDSSSCTLAGCPPIADDTTVESVDYYLDDPGMTGAPLNNDPDAPFDFNGGTLTDGNGFNFDDLPLGEHSITTVVHEVGGGEMTFTRSFLVVPVDAILPEALDPSMLEEDPQLDEGAGLIKDRDAAIALGKAFFWDVQAGSNGDVACATCHYHAGADNRILNTVNPGFNGNFDAVANAGEILDADDFPFHRFADQLTGDGGLEQSFDDVAGSQGVLKKDFVNVNPGDPIDTASGPAIPESVFLDSNGDPTMQVTGRNTPTNINAIFN
ncbi:MAG: cytochrome c peroxidase, partial [Gammaproteobacteria bacterium]